MGFSCGNLPQELKFSTGEQVVVLRFLSPRRLPYSPLIPRRETGCSNNIRVPFLLGSGFHPPEIGSSGAPAPPFRVFCPFLGFSPSFEIDFSRACKLRLVAVLCLGDGDNAMIRCCAMEFLFLLLSLLLPVHMCMATVVPGPVTVLLWDELCLLFAVA